MDITIRSDKLSGTVNVIPSKSQAHRYLIAAAFSKGTTTLICPETNQDIEATADCLNALGAHISKNDVGYVIHPIGNIPKSAVLNCRESGSTLRFLLPIAGALGVDATFLLKGRLPSRPLSPLWEEMERNGCHLSRPTDNTIHCTGKLLAAEYFIDGSVSSQFITGLMFALPLIGGDSKLHITGNVESKPYIHMTEQAISRFGYPYSPSPGILTVEGDWSNGAFWLAAKTLGNSLTVTGLNHASIQGDRAADQLLPALEAHIIIDASDIPDLVPIMAVVAATNHGATFTNIQRLRLKESDRVTTVEEMIRNLGGTAYSTESTLIVNGTGLVGGVVDSHNDHRIAMSAAIAATVCTSPVTILGAEAVNKSYPTFWEEYRRLGGHYEQYIR